RQRDGRAQLAFAVAGKDLDPIRELITGDDVENAVVVEVVEVEADGSVGVEIAGHVVAQPAELRSRPDKCRDLAAVALADKGEVGDVVPIEIENPGAHVRHRDAEVDRSLADVRGGALEKVALVILQKNRGDSQGIEGDDVDQAVSIEIGRADAYHGLLHRY